MNKKELVLLLSQRNGCTQKEAGQFLDTFCAVLAEKLAEGEAVQLMGTGTFLVRERPARMARNPKTNAVVEVPASKAPVFKPGKALKERVNGRHE